MNQRDAVFSVESFPWHSDPVVALPGFARPDSRGRLSPHWQWQEYADRRAGARQQRSLRSLRRDEKRGCRDDNGFDDNRLGFI